MALAACLVAVTIFGLFFYLAMESRYAFDRKFGFGYRIAAQTGGTKPVDPVNMDPNASLLVSNAEGAPGLDEKDEGILMPTLEELAGMSGTATGTALTGDIQKVDPTKLYRDDWRLQQTADKGDRFLLFAFATPEYKESKIRVAWEPDASFNPKLAPYDLRLKLVRAPEGVNAPVIDIDLISKPSGEVFVPTWIAKSDEERAEGYVFALEATPKSRGNFTATLGAFFTTGWDPTLPYAQFGFAPLLIGTLLITLIAMLLATPVALFAAIFLSEIAPPRLREWLKPVIELLASIPTVVLGYFGLMLVAPQLMASFGKALQMESGRSLLTAGIMMAVLVLPTMVSVAEDALRTMPNTIRDGASAMGFTRAESIRKVLLPAAKTGIFAAAMLGFARAIGETMIVWILSGGTPTMPKAQLSALAQPARGIPDTIGIEMGNVEFEMPHYGHLFLLGLSLFLLTVAINLVGFYYSRRHSWQA